jgi:hypothetical protein
MAGKAVGDQVGMLHVAELAVGRPAWIEDAGGSQRRLAMPQRVLQAGRAGLVVTAVKNQGNH